MKKKDKKHLVTGNFTEPYRETAYIMELLRRVYDKIEMNHLTDDKLIPTYCEKIDFPRSLGRDIFNYLQSKDQVFRNIVIRRQKNFRRRKKRELRNKKND